MQTMKLGTILYWDQGLCQKTHVSAHFVAKLEVYLSFSSKIRKLRIFVEEIRCTKSYKFKVHIEGLFFAGCRHFSTFFQVFVKMFEVKQTRQIY